jgi:hypothetical protein
MNEELLSLLGATPEQIAQARQRSGFEELGLLGQALRQAGAPAPRGTSTLGRLGQAAGGVHTSTSSDYGHPLARPVTQTAGTGFAEKANSRNRKAGEQLTPGQKKLDESAAADIYQWQSGGGQDMVAQIAQLKPVIEDLEAGKPITGVSVAVQPDILLAMTNPKHFSLA